MFFKQQGALDQTKEQCRQRVRKVLPLLAVLLISLILLPRLTDRAYRRGLRDGTESRTLEVTPEVRADVSTLREIIAPVARLATQEYYYTDAGLYEKSRTLFGTGIVLPFSTDRTMYTYTGVISAGIDLNLVRFVVNETRKTVTVNLPQPAILSHELGKDGFQYYDLQNSVLVSSDLGDYEAFRRSLMADQEKKLLDNGAFWENTRENIKTVLSNLLTLSGQVAGYDILYRWVG